ncbi:MAG: SEC-C metal-binding domain-containing protein [Bryobacteraceae bacterium]|jgi:transposase-like protein
MIDLGISSQQRHVIDALSSGASLSDAAALAGVHRNTVAYWRRNFSFFRAALVHAQYDRAQLFRGRAEALADLAFETVRDILSDPKASPSVRLKAATFIIEIAVTPTSLEPDKPIGFDELLNDPFDGKIPGAQQPEPEAEEKRQPEPAAPAAQICTTANPVPSPSEPYRRPNPKIGRNQPCPCGSGQKHKHCCLGKPLAATA